MATIKGQNLRLFWNRFNSYDDNIPFAGAKSCDISIQSNFQSDTTKDTPDGWEEQFLAGLSWSMKSDGLVQNLGSEYRRLLTSVAKAFDETTGYYSEVIRTEDKRSLTFDIDNSGANGYFIGLIRSQSPDMSNPTRIDTFVPNDGSPAYYQVVVSEDAAIRLQIEQYLQDFTPQIGQHVYATFATTNNASHSDKGDLLFFGEAIVSDISFNAENRNASTFSLTLTGVGKLYSTSMPIMGSLEFNEIYPIFNLGEYAGTEVIYLPPWSGDAFDIEGKLTIIADRNNYTVLLRVIQSQSTSFANVYYGSTRLFSLTQVSQNFAGMKGWKIVDMIQDDEYLDSIYIVDLTYQALTVIETTQEQSGNENQGGGTSSSGGNSGGGNADPNDVTP